VGVYALIDADDFSGSGVQVPAEIADDASA
jgi:hypothetical protein